MRLSEISEDDLQTLKALHKEFEHARVLSEDIRILRGVTDISLVEDTWGDIKCFIIFLEEKYAEES